MKLENFKLFLRNSRFQGPLLFPLRFYYGIRFILKKSKYFFVWLIKSSEHTNFTYELTNRNLTHLAWFVSQVAEISIAEAREFIIELFSDVEFDENLKKIQKANYVRKYDSGINKVGRRVSWYAIVRAKKPNLVVETGTDKGLGTLLIARALQKNGFGKVVTIDINPKSGVYLDGQFSSQIKVIHSDSLIALRDMPQIDIFIHDSNHSAIHEKKEFELIAGKLNKDSIILTDNAHASDSLSDWSEENDYRFIYFQENPSNHWYPGASVSAAIKVS